MMYKSLKIIDFRKLCCHHQIVCKYNLEYSILFMFKVDLFWVILFYILCFVYYYFRFKFCMIVDEEILF